MNHHDQDEERSNKTNPLELPVIVDSLFKLLPFEEVKKARLVSKTWNEIGNLEIIKRPKKSMLLDSIDDLGSDGKLGTLIQLQNRHRNAKGIDVKFFTSFSININLFSRPDISNLIENFSILNLKLKAVLSTPSPNIEQVQFPMMANLEVLEVDHFVDFLSYFEPIDFSLQFPKLEKLEILDIKPIVTTDIASKGESVKSISFKKRGLDPNLNQLEIFKLVQVFPNLESLEFTVRDLEDEDNLLDNLHLWLNLNKIVIHCELKELHVLNGDLLSDIRNVEILVNCGHLLRTKESYLTFINEVMTIDGPPLQEWMLFNYELFKSSITHTLGPIRTTCSISFTGNISICEDFKTDLRGLFPRISFRVHPIDPLDDLLLELAYE